jgi:hypothetical protein
VSTSKNKECSRNHGERHDLGLIAIEKPFNVVVVFVSSTPDIRDYFKVPPLLSRLNSKRDNKIGLVEVPAKFIIFVHDRQIQCPKRIGVTKEHWYVQDRLKESSNVLIFVEES